MAQGIGVRGQRRRKRRGQGAGRDFKNSGTIALASLYLTGEILEDMDQGVSGIWKIAARQRSFESSVMADFHDSIYAGKIFERGRWMIGEWVKAKGLSVSFTKQPHLPFHSLIPPELLVR